jgi:alkylhydroperoxidase family enzyme
VQRQSVCKNATAKNNRGGVLNLRLKLQAIRSAVLENSLVCALGRAASVLHHRWLALSFARRFYHQASTSPSVGNGSAGPVLHEDFTERLYRRSLPGRLHTLVQLRVASRIASIAETEARAQMCREAGWSNEQIGAALIGNLNGTFSEPERLVLRYADDMTRTPIDIDPQVVKQLGHYFGKADLMELTACIAHANFRTRFADADRKLQ